MKSLTDKYDKNNALVSIYAGVGGDDAKDWANMLFNMYLKYATKRGWRFLVTDDRAAVMVGEYAYGTLKKEAGVHRLVRISPFSPKRLRHTSFALVEVVPELPEVEEKNLQIPPEDLKVEMSRGGGRAGKMLTRLRPPSELFIYPPVLPFLPAPNARNTPTASAPWKY